MDDSSTDEYVPSNGSSPSASRNDDNSSPRTLDRKSAQPESHKSLFLASSQHQSRKRKCSTSRSRGDTPKRRGCFYTDSYRRLLNVTIDDTAVADADSNYRMSFQESQIGLTVWLPDEKERLFAALDRRGKHDLYNISNAIRTKSGVEVKVYLQLLQESLHHEYLYPTRHYLVKQADVPAAFEIGRECVQALDNAAQELSDKQDKHLQLVEESQHGDLWLLDTKIASALREMEDEGEASGPFEEHDLRKANILLNLKSFLELSKTVFMNSSNLDDNWRSYAESQQTPSMFCTSFLDFYNLTTIITRRLVSSAIFFAMSRRRATETSSYTPKKLIRKEDVFAALKVLNLEGDAKEFWVRAPRRCNLEVSEQVRRQKGRPGWVGPSLNYDEVERRLREDFSSRASSAAPSSAGGATPSENHDDSDTAEEALSNDSEDQKSHMATQSDGISQSDLESRTHDSGSRKERANSPRDFDIMEERYLKGLDHQSSIQEERRLWYLLGRPIPQYLWPEDVVLPAKPPIPRKLKGDLIGWRDLMKYKDSWEKYEVPIPEEEFAKNQLRRRNTQSKEGLPDPKYSSDTENFESIDGDNTEIGSNAESDKSGSPVHPESIEVEDQREEQDHQINQEVPDLNHDS